jgi:hypothetical protein
VGALADEFDTLYERLAPNEMMLFEDSVTRSRYRAHVTFSRAAMMVGCGVVTMHTLRCGEDTIRATRMYPDCQFMHNSLTYNARAAAGMLTRVAAQNSERGTASSRAHLRTTAACVAVSRRDTREHWTRCSARCK